ncbi:Alpha crystallin/Heat shock protein family and Alpha crystallin/Hsp20 domain and HSP20-like chaperone domain-containing protein [Strongyloides ratti]|uniref:Alpha crystallin/Heat shock protein family and Alpha crystallin/Hsp20 domain and HSP20-like chaperone domain-containing protein n=1 Tax=Strongyloides ratti TaxID=34506 RepID=A0A090L2E9_STRRB|nr:Alpha crystallin/Heat shock protein family and Alpha crystallin/Hsp20 domain and HSP20-like chaperone domain-containing protein [Strongyloides ratti]CEF62257.1 Alpha crystallin/Heat shock protein family and Alpha crystallin/Hsp20 domain and HSP20-like chaperone domain-containing protein [Strongyloides ratti]
MTIVSRRPFDDDPFFGGDINRDDFWNRSLIKDFNDWPKDWPRPGELMKKFRSSFSSDFESTWPSHWPSINTVMPRFNRHLSSISPNWRSDPYWISTYPTWAEPTFKDGVDVSVNVINNQNEFTVDVDAYQFKPEELTVKTMDDTLIIEGKHSDIRDNDNYTKMYFIRKYQLPEEVDITRLESSIDRRGRLIVSAPKFTHRQNINYGRNLPIQQTPYSRSRDERSYATDYNKHYKSDIHEGMSSGSSGYGHSPPHSNYNSHRTQSPNRRPDHQQSTYHESYHRRGMSHDRNNYESRNYSPTRYSPSPRPYSNSGWRNNYPPNNDGGSSKETYERNTRYREETFSSTNSNPKFTPEPIINTGGGYVRERNIPVRFEGDSSNIHNLRKTRSGLTDEDISHGLKNSGHKEQYQHQYERRDSNQSSTNSASRSKSASRMYQSSKYSVKEGY